MIVVKYYCNRCGNEMSANSPEVSEWGEGWDNHVRISGPRLGEGYCIDCMKSFDSMLNTWNGAAIYTKGVK